MFRALGILAICMFGGRSVLAWLEPEPARPSVAIGGQDAGLIASHRMPARRWQGVEIHPLDAPSSSRPRGVLAATLRSVRAHFVITEDGALEPSPSWQQQEPIGDSRYIRVGLYVRDGDGQTLERQVKTICELLDELRAAIDVYADGPSLPVILARQVSNSESMQRLSRLLSQRYSRG